MTPRGMVSTSAGPEPRRCVCRAARPRVAGARARNRQGCPRFRGRLWPAGPPTAASTPFGPWGRCRVAVSWAIRRACPISGNKIGYLP